MPFQTIMTQSIKMKNKNRIVYIITNLINRKIYIGQDSYNRPNYFGSGKILKNAIKKYGKNNFKKETLCYCQNDNELDKMETFWINEKDSTNPKIGYNIVKFGYSHVRGQIPWNKGKIGGLSKETLNKMRISHLKENLAKETIDKMRDGKLGKPGNARGCKHSEESKKKNSISHLKENLKKETLEKMRNAKLNTTLSNVHKLNITKGIALKFKELREKGLSVGGSPKGQLKEKVQCPHCGKIGGKPSMHIWHFDKCKNRI